MSRIVAGLVMIVVGLIAPPLLLPPIFTPWTLLFAWFCLAVVVVGVVNVARGAFEKGWMR